MASHEASGRFRLHPSKRPSGPGDRAPRRRPRARSATGRPAAPPHVSRLPLVLAARGGRPLLYLPSRRASCGCAAGRGGGAVSASRPFCSSDMVLLARAAHRSFWRLSRFADAAGLCRLQSCCLCCYALHECKTQRLIRPMRAVDRCCRLHYFCSTLACSRRFANRLCSLSRGPLGAYVGLYASPLLTGAKRSERARSKRGLRRRPKSRTWLFILADARSCGQRGQPERRAEATANQPAAHASAARQPQHRDAATMDKSYGSSSAPTRSSTTKTPSRNNKKPQTVWQSLARSSSRAAINTNIGCCAARHLFC